MKCSKSGKQIEDGSKMLQPQKTRRGNFIVVVLSLVTAMLLCSVDSASGTGIMTMTTEAEWVSFILEGSGNATVDWGDGTKKETLKLKLDNMMSVDYRYSNNTQRIITIYGDNIIKLECSYKNLTSLDVSKNTALIVLICNGNKLTSLDVSNNTALERLYCDGNQLTNLDLSNNAALVELYCRQNQLTSLDVSKNTALVKMSCEENQFTSLYVNKNTEWRSLSYDRYKVVLRKSAAQSGSSKITMTAKAEQVTIQLKGVGEATVDWGDGSEKETLKLEQENFSIFRHRNSNGTERNITIYGDGVTQLDCSNNNLTSLDVSNNTALNLLSCRNNELTRLDVSKNTEMVVLSCSENQLTSLDVSNNTDLLWLGCSGNKLTSLDVSKNTSLKNLYYDEEKVVLGKTVAQSGSNSGGSSTSPSATDNRRLTGSASGSSRIMTITTESERVRIQLKGSGNATVDWGDGLENETLMLEKENYVNFAHSYQNKTKRNIVIYGDNITTLSSDFSLTSLDVSKNTTLKELVLFYCQLTSLDVTKNTALEKLICDNSRLTSLDVSKNTALHKLSCTNSQLTSLDVSKNSVLVELSCHHNQLTNLDVTKNTALQKLDCQGNQITSLDVSKNVLLKELHCRENRISSLDVSNNTALDVSRNLALGKFSYDDKVVVRKSEAQISSSRTSQGSSTSSSSGSPVEKTYQLINGAIFVASYSAQDDMSLSILNSEMRIKFTPTSRSEGAMSITLTQRVSSLMGQGSNRKDSNTTTYSITDDGRIVSGNGKVILQRSGNYLVSNFTDERGNNIRFYKR